VICGILLATSVLYFMVAADFHNASGNFIFMILFVASLIGCIHAVVADSGKR
jgi:hypothetical protein